MANKVYTDNFSEFLSDYSDNSAWMRMKFEEISYSIKLIQKKYNYSYLDESIEICGRSNINNISKSKLLIESLKPLFMEVNDAKLDDEDKKNLNVILSNFIDIAKKTLNSDIARATLDIGQKF